MKKLTNLIHQYKHGLAFTYFLLYIPWFIHLENTVTTEYHIIYCSLDDHIPFCEYFVVPYLLWFLFIATTFIYFFFVDKTEFYQLCTFMFTGMTIFLIISTVYPNGQNLRPEVFDNTNIFTQLVQHLYSIDTPTNILPSLHAFNTISACIAILYNKHLRKYKSVQIINLVLSISIVLSTMFLKQHSAIDVIAAIIISAILYPFVYGCFKLKYFRVK